MQSAHWCLSIIIILCVQAEDIMAKFKVHAREEVSIGSTINTCSNSSTSSSGGKSSGLIFSYSYKHHPPENANSKNAKEKNKSVVTEYSVEFLGKFEVAPPSTTKLTLFQIIDKMVSRIRESQSRPIKRRRTLGSQIRDKITSSSSLKSQSNISQTSEDSNLFSTSKISKNVKSDSIREQGNGSKVTTSNDPTDSVSVGTDSKVILRNDSLDDPDSNSLSSISCPSLPSQYSLDFSVKTVSSGSGDSFLSDSNVKFSAEGSSEDKLSEQSDSISKETDPVNMPQIAVTKEVCAADRLKESGNLSPNPDKLNLSRSESTKSLDSTSRGSSNHDLSEGETYTLGKRKDSTDFDTIPELSKLQDSLEFQALSEGSPLLMHARKVNMFFSSLSVLLVSKASGERIMKKSIRKLSSCSQV